MRMCIGALIIGALIIVQTKRFTMNVDQQIAFTYRLAIIFFCSFCSVLVVVFPLWYFIAKQIPSLIWVYMNMWTVPVIFSLFAQNSIVCMWTMRNFYSYVLCKYFFCAFCHAQFNRTTTTTKNIYKIEMCMSALKRNARTEHTQFLIKRFHFISQIKQRCAGIRKICFIRYTIRIFMDEQI